MKTTMKIFAALTIMLGFAVTSYGQSVGAAAKVMTAIQIAEGNDLQFGNVTRGNQKTIGTGAQVVLQGVVAGTTETAGSFTVSKGEFSQVTLTFDLPATLNNSGTPLTINYATYDGNVLGAIIVGGTPTPFLPSDGLDLAISSTAYAAAFAANTFDVRIGGTVEPTGTQASGDYTGTITMTATYN